MTNQSFNLVVIGSGPAGQKAAIAAAKLRKRVAVVERKQMLGGVCVHTGTIPSKTLREAVLYLTGFRQRSFYGRDYVLKEDISVQDLSFRVQTLIARETAVVHSQFDRNHVQYFEGTGQFHDSHTIEVKGEDEGAAPFLLRADHILIACGTRPDFVDRQIVDALSYHLSEDGVTLRLGEKVTKVGIDSERDRVFAELQSG